MDGREKDRDFASVIKDYVEMTAPESRKPIKLGSKNQAKLERIRQLAAKMRGK